MALTQPEQDPVCEPETDTTDQDDALRAAEWDDADWAEEEERVAPWDGF